MQLFGKVYLLPGAGHDELRRLRPARPVRAWMDRTPERYAYRCIPLSAANTMGWEILNPVAAEFYWSGMSDLAHLKVWTERRHRWGPKTHFGNGVVTWELPYLFRTPPEYGMVITGPANHDKTGIVPLDGFVRTDWLPYPFTMSWRLTEPNRAVRFEEGEPIGRIYPYPLGVLDEFELHPADWDEDPALKKRFTEWAASRDQGYREQRRSVEQGGGTMDVERDRIWGKRYARGQGAGGAIVEHQTVFRCRELKDPVACKPEKPKDE